MTSARQKMIWCNGSDALYISRVAAKETAAALDDDGKMIGF